MIYVYYSDGYCDNGDVGLEQFPDLQSAAEFIEKRLGADCGRSCRNYTVIDGHEMKLTAVEVVKKVLITP
jgi:hypothetical protein